MTSVVSDKPYVPVPPYRGTLWPRAMYLYVPRYLRRRYGVAKVEIVGAEKLSASIAAGHGILITPNHCRDEDPFVVSLLARQVGRPVFVVASAHLFMGNKLQAFLLRRAGAFSIYREGMDKQAVQTSIEILETAQRPLVIFPEGHISRTNDRLTPMLEGTALIARQAAKKRAKENKQVVVHPVAIRYAFPFDVESAAARMLDEIETRLTWRPSRGIPLVERFRKVGDGLLALKELQYLGHTQEGTIDERVARLIDAILKPLEAEWVNANGSGHPVARVKRLRTAILPDMIKGEISEEEKARRWRLLGDADLAQQLYHYPPGYISEDAPQGRIIETVERFEEDLTGKVTVHGPVEVRVTVGDAIEVSTGREARGESDPLMAAIEGQLRSMLGIPAGAAPC
ncbi:MAG TPA: lysophospholipid acyltransferase family protein [Pirellulales bacterium]|jgi:1-acyl-sn-glycerol-3-phosphate acyltransferase|nr:lysophospholipid acyltransferase family protein [Pirellulales bacterium]